VTLHLWTAATNWRFVHPPRCYMSMENHGEAISTGENRFVNHSALWQFYQQSHLVANQEDLGEGNYTRPWQYMGASGQRHAPAALYPWERTPGTH
jgi:hypothetical protein